MMKIKMTAVSWSGIYFQRIMLAPYGPQNGRFKPLERTLTDHSAKDTDVLSRLMSH